MGVQKRSKDLLDYKKLDGKLRITASKFGKKPNDGWIFELILERTMMRRHASQKTGDQKR